MDGLASPAWCLLSFTETRRCCWEQVRAPSPASCMHMEHTLHFPKAFYSVTFDFNKLLLVTETAQDTSLCSVAFSYPRRWKRHPSPSWLSPRGPGGLTLTDMIQLQVVNWLLAETDFFPH